MAQYDELRELQNRRRELINDIMSDNMHGRHIYLIGSAEYGPTNEPIRVRSTAGLYKNFGHKGSLINAFHCIKYTNRNIPVYLVKTTGVHASIYMNVNILEGDILRNAFSIHACESNEIYNEVYIINDVDSITFCFPNDMNMPSMKYYYSDYPTIEKLCDAINSDTNKKIGKLYAYYTCDPSVKTDTAFYSVNPTKIYMFGGECGLGYTKNMLYNCLEKTYEILESSRIDIIIPVDALLDDAFPNDDENHYGMQYYRQFRDYLTEDTEGHKYSFLNQLVNFCIRQLSSGVVTHGVIGYSSYNTLVTDYLYEADELEMLYISCMKHNESLLENPFYGFLVSAVAGDIMYNCGAIIDNAYLAYGTFCAMVKTTSGTTNLPLSDTISIYEEFSEDVLERLCDNHIIAFRHSPLHEKPVAYSGITVSDDDNLKYFVNVRMVQMCISYLDRIMQFYLGMDMQMILKEGYIEKDIKQMLETLKSIDYITYYEYKLVPYYMQGEIKVYLTLISNFMVKSVTLCTSIRAEFSEDLIQ